MVHDPVVADDRPALHIHDLARPQRPVVHATAEEADSLPKRGEGPAAVLAVHVVGGQVLHAGGARSRLRSRHARVQRDGEARKGQPGRSSWASLKLALGRPTLWPQGRPRTPKFAPLAAVGAIALPWQPSEKSRGSEPVVWSGIPVGRNRPYKYVYRSF